VPPTGVVEVEVELTAPSTKGVRVGDSAVLHVSRASAPDVVLASTITPLRTMSKTKTTTTTTMTTMTFASAVFTMATRVPSQALSLWSPDSPTLFIATVLLVDANGSTIGSERALSTSRATFHRTSFGFRSFTTNGSRFLLNGEPIFLSGFGDDSVYPTTYSPPTDPEVYRHKVRSSHARSRDEITSLRLEGARRSGLL
jgi:hypothetical protein